MTTEHFAVFWAPKAGRPFRTQTIAAKQITRLYDKEGQEIHQVSYLTRPDKSQVLREISTLTLSPAPHEIAAGLKALGLLEGWFPLDNDYFGTDEAANHANQEYGGYLELVKTEGSVGRIEAFFLRNPQPTYEQLKEISHLYPRIEGILEAKHNALLEQFCNTVTGLFEPQLEKAGRDEAKMLKQYFGYLISASGLATYDRDTRDRILPPGLQKIEQRLREMAGYTTRRIPIVEGPGEADQEREQKACFSDIEKRLARIGWSKKGEVSELERHYQKALEKFNFGMSNPIPDYVKDLGRKIQGRKWSP